MSKESRVLVDTRKMLGPAASWLAAVSQALGVLVGGSRPGVLPFSGVEGQDEPGMKHPGSLARSLRKCYQEQGYRAHTVLLCVPAGRRGWPGATRPSAAGEGPQE